MRRWGGSLLASLLLLVVIAGPASAHNNLGNDDDDQCVSTNYGLFYISGPDAGAHVHNTSAAYGVCHWWFQAVCSTCDIVHAAHWYLPIDYDYNGPYRVETWIANDDHCTTQNARYRRFATGTDGGVTEKYPINQLGNQAKLKCITCYPKGEVNYDQFYGSSGAYMQLVDRSNDGQARVCVDYMWFDAIH